MTGLRNEVVDIDADADADVIYTGWDGGRKGTDATRASCATVYMYCIDKALKSSTSAPFLVFSTLL